MKLPKYTIVGLAADLADWLIVGMIPILGDAFDIMMVIFWYWILKNPIALVGAVELIPFVDVLPVHTAIGLYADMRKKT